MAPGSSGFGKATVGNAGSGSDWLGTTTGAANPAPAKARCTTSLPTPCSEVWTIVSSRGPCGSTTAVAAAR